MSYSNAHIQNIEKGYWRIYLQGSNGETDIKNRLIDMGRGKEMVMNREAWRAAIHGVAKSETRLSDWTELPCFTLVSGTTEYYSAIKRNIFESVLMRWINLKPVIQSGKSQKEKDKYHIVYCTYMEFRKMVLKNLFTGQQWRNRYRE